MESLACECKMGLTPFVERATKCFATAALCEKMKETPSMTFKWDTSTSRCCGVELQTHVFGVFQEPGFGRLSIGDGLLGGESLSMTELGGINLKCIQDKSYIHSSQNCKVANHHPGEFLYKITCVIYITVALVYMMPE